MFHRTFALLLAALPLPAVAQSAEVFATYWANSGSLPPEYAWDVDVTITSDGQLVLKRCKGYETEGPACKTRKAKVDAAKVEAIRAAVTAADIVANPPRSVEDTPVGGGSSGGTIVADGQTYILPAWPVAEDAERVSTVQNAITAAIPARFARFLTGQ
jgi:hypothetical protein